MFPLGFCLSGAKGLLSLSLPRAEVAHTLLKPHNNQLDFLPSDSNCPPSSLFTVSNQRSSEPGTPRLWLQAQEGCSEPRRAACVETEGKLSLLNLRDAGRKYAGL